MACPQEYSASAQSSVSGAPAEAINDELRLNETIVLK